MHYILKFNVRTNDYLAEKMDIGNIDASELLDGKRLNRPDPQIQLAGTRGFVSDYIANVHGIDIVSEEIKNLFVEYGNDFVEIYPVMLKRKTDKKFYMVHVLDNIGCFDFENSVYDEYTPGSGIIRKIDKLVLDGKCDGRHFFRIKEFEFEIIVSDEFKQAAESRNFDVMKFIPITDFKFDPTKFDW